MQVLKYSESDVARIKQELEMNFQARLLVVQRDTASRQQKLEQEHAAKLKQAEKARQKLHQQVDTLTKSREEMKWVRAGSAGGGGGRGESAGQGCGWGRMCVYQGGWVSGGGCVHAAKLKQAEKARQKLHQQVDTLTKSREEMKWVRAGSAGGGGGRGESAGQGYGWGGCVCIRGDG